MGIKGIGVEICELFLLSAEGWVPGRASIEVVRDFMCLERKRAPGRASILPTVHWGKNAEVRLIFANCDTCAIVNPTRSRREGSMSRYAIL